MIVFSCVWMGFSDKVGDEIWCFNSCVLVEVMVWLMVVKSDFV